MNQYGFTILIAAALAGALVVSGLDPALANPSLAAAGAFIALACLAPPSGRVALLGLQRLHAPAMFAFAVLVLALVLSSLGLTGEAGERARHAALQLFTLALLAGAVGAIAGAFGRTRMLSFLIGAAVLAAFVILAAGGLDAQTPVGRIPAGLQDPAVASAYGLVAILSIFAAADELRRRPAAGGRSLPPLARRMFLPMAGLTTAFAMLLLAGSASALAGAAVGGVAFAAALALRARTSRVGLALVPAVAALSVFAAGLAALAAGAGGGLGWIGAGPIDETTLSPATDALARWGERPALGHGLNSLQLPSSPTALRWLAETGYLGMTLALIVAAALLAGLITLKDRGRPFSRGFILAAGLVGFAVTDMLLSSAFDQPAPAFALAIMLGLALSYLDFESTSRARTPHAG
ncbi:MAG: hypothetical protein NW206_11355 [Hyphomonadaceae bacterium]|nr:hypothetical protein [Hyphomonadaceae bacterium]